MFLCYHSQCFWSCRFKPLCLGNHSELDVISLYLGDHSELDVISYDVFLSMTDVVASQNIDFCSWISPYFSM